MVKIKYVFSRGDTYYWQRRIPKDLAERYPATGPLKINLQTSDPRVIASKVAKLNREHEALWEAMRRDPNLTPQSAREAALAILKQHGLSVRGQPNDELALSMFYDRLDGKRESYADAQHEPEEAYRYGDPSEYLTKAELEATRLLEGAEQFLMSDALEVYLAEHVKRGKPGFEKLETYTRRAFGKLTELLGDKILREVSRDDAKAFREKLLATLKTASVKRNINVVKAVFSSAIRDNDVVGRAAISKSLKFAFSEIIYRDMYDNSPSMQMPYPEVVKGCVDALNKWDEQGHFKRYLRVLSSILENLKDANIEPSEIYPRTFKSLLSQDELKLIYFACFDEEWTRLKSLVEYYGVLRHLRGEGTGAPADYFSFFGREAFAE